MLPDPQHIIKAREAALELGIEEDAIQKVLAIASQFYHDEQSKEHPKMTRESLAALGILYKYRNPDFDYNWEILEDQKIYFADPKSFNDPFDSNIKLRFDLLEVDELRKRFDRQVKIQQPGAGYFLRKPQVDRYIANVYNPVTHDAAVSKWIESFTGKMRMFCICPDKANILLWSHYANNHKGFAIGFDPNKFYDFWSVNKGFLLGHIAYRNEYPILLPPADTDIETKQDIVVTVTNVKSKIWSYEQEVRMTVFDGPEKLSFDAELITEIVIGCKTNPKHKDRILDIVAAKYPHASVYQAKLSRDSFALDFDKIR